MWLMQSLSECFFAVANNVAPVDDIHEVHNGDYMLTEAARSNARIWFPYVA